MTFSDFINENKNNEASFDYKTPKSIKEFMNKNPSLFKVKSRILRKDLGYSGPLKNCIEVLTRFAYGLVRDGNIGFDSKYRAAIFIMRIVSYYELLVVPHQTKEGEIVFFLSKDGEFVASNIEGLRNKNNIVELIVDEIETKIKSQKN